MKCVGCDGEVDKPSAFAIMNEADIEPTGVGVAKKGPGRFHAMAVCGECFTDPAHRTRVVKAHYALPGEVERMLGRAGSTTIG